MCWPSREAQDVTTAVSPVTWRQGVTRPGWSPHSADGTRPHTVNKANYLLVAPSWCQAGAGSPVLGMSSKVQHCKALAQHHKATTLELQSTLCLGELLPKSAPAPLLRAPLPQAVTEPLRRIADGVWLAGAAWVSTTPFPPHPPATIGLCHSMAAGATHTPGMLVLSRGQPEPAGLFRCH